MAKKLVNQTIVNPNSNDELELVFLYEQFFILEQVADPKNVQSFFHSLFDLDLSDDRADRVSERIIERLTRIRLKETITKLKKKGYKSHEFDGMKEPKE